MFDTVRNHSKLMMGLLFVLIIPSFVLFGIQSYTQFNESSHPVAKVDGNKITQSEWDAAHRRDSDRLREQMPNLDAKLLDSPDAKMASLERLVNERLLGAVASKRWLSTSDQRLARELTQIPEIAALRGPDGKLDMDRYRQLAASQNMSPEMFEASIRQELSNRQVLGSVAASTVGGQRQGEMALDAYLQRREIQIQTFLPAQFVAKISLTDADLEAHYKAHSDRFKSRESADIEYLVLDLASIEKGIRPPEQELRGYYEQNLQRLSGQEQRRASHILIGVSKDAPAADQEKARTTANALLEQVRKEPKRFAELARKNSQDPGSAARGGDLDFFARGAMVKPFEDAVFGMKKGDPAQLVQSEFGWHIITLTDIKTPQAPSFEAMRPQLEADLRRQMAQRQFAEMADTFTNRVYEQADSFKGVAEQLKLSVVQANGVTRSGVAGSPVLANAKLLQALFSPDSISKKRNTEAVEVAPNTLVSARLVQYRPSEVKSLDLARDEVRKDLTQERALAMAREEGAKQLAAYQSGADAKGLGAVMVVSRDQPQNLPGALLDAALRADPAKLPQWVGVELPEQGFSVVRVKQVLPRPESTEAQRKETRQQFQRMWTQAQTQAYMQWLKTEFKAEILVKASSIKTEITP